MCALNDISAFDHQQPANSATLRGAARGASGATYYTSLACYTSLGEQKIGRIKSDKKKQGKVESDNERSAAKVGGLSGVGAPPEPERLLLSTTTAKLPAGALRRPASRRCAPPCRVRGGLERQTAIALHYYREIADGTCPPRVWINALPPTTRRNARRTSIP